MNDIQKVESLIRKGMLPTVPSRQAPLAWKLDVLIKVDDYSVYVQRPSQQPGVVLYDPHYVEWVTLTINGSFRISNPLVEKPLGYQSSMIALPL
jgi:Fe-S cluster assembly iron-binding protein IscA